MGHVRCSSRVEAAHLFRPVKRSQSRAFPDKHVRMAFVCVCVCLSQLAQQRNEDELEAGLGFALFTSGDDKLGWLMNLHTVSTKTHTHTHTHTHMQATLNSTDARGGSV